MIDLISKIICKVCLFLLVVMLVGITLFALINVFGRYILGHTIFWVEEVTSLVMGWMVTFGVPVLWIQKNHIVMDALDYFINDKQKHYWDIGINILGIIVGVFFLYSGIKALKMNSGYTVSLLKYDESVRYLFVPVMGAFLSIASVLTLIKTIMQKNTKEEK